MLLEFDNFTAKSRVLLFPLDATQTNKIQCEFGQVIAKFTHFLNVSDSALKLRNSFLFFIFSFVFKKSVMY